MKNYKLEYSKKFTKSFDNFEKIIQKQIIEVLKKLSSDYNSCNIIKLSDIKKTYRLRSGDYRILFEKNDEILVILLVDVKHRKEVYRDL
jgi:mRNA interferase RelE/StbE